MYTYVYMLVGKVQLVVFISQISQYHMFTYLKVELQLQWILFSSYRFSNIYACATKNDMCVKHMKNIYSKLYMHVTLWRIAVVTYIQLNVLIPTEIIDISTK